MARVLVGTNEKGTYRARCGTTIIANAVKT
jgi:hypothetical protein